MIELRSLNKNYGSLPVLRNINMRYMEGKVYGLVGENGAGKSTLFRCIMNMEDHAGEILKPQGMQTGYLTDAPYFYPLVTGMEHIEFCLRARKADVSREEIKRLNLQFGLPLDKFPSKYSLGMKKRLQLMVLILQQSDFYILDEPFNGLDLSGNILLKKWIKGQKANGRTILLSSHIISALTDVCDEISYIHHGEILKTYQGNVPAAQIEEEIMQSL